MFGYWSGNRYTVATSSLRLVSPFERSFRAPLSLSQARPVRPSAPTMAMVLIFFMLLLLGSFGDRVQDDREVVGLARCQRAEGPLVYRAVGQVLAVVDDVLYVRSVRAGAATGVPALSAVVARVPV